MKLRNATNADRDAVRELVFSVLAEYGLKNDPTGTDLDMDNIQASYLDRGGIFEVVEADDGRIIGTVGLYPLKDGVCELRKMYLAREARGTGLGKKLMERMLDRARALGFRRMALETAAPLVEAIGLYKRYGFEPTVEHELSARCDQAFALDLRRDASVTNDDCMKRTTLEKRPDRPMNKSQRQPSAVIFDLDGTLTKPCIDFDAIRAATGINGPILEALPGLDENARRRTEVILAEHEAEAARNAVLYDRAVEVVAACRAAGHPVAILTRNSRISLTAVLERHGIVVDAARTREEGAVKPSAEPVLSICREVRAEPSRSWMIGDFLFDIMSGEAAGTHTVLMIGDGPAPEYAGRAEHVIRRLPELLALLDLA